jgi:hypothetical protein
MSISAKLDSEILNFIEKQIKKQQQSLILFFPVLIVLFIAVVGRYEGKMPPWYFYTLLVPFYIYPCLYIPLTRGLLLRKIFYKAEIINEEIVFTTFGALWANEQIITLPMNNIKIDQTHSPRFFAGIYPLNTIYLDDKKYFIFNSLLIKLGLL